VQHG